MFTHTASIKAACPTRSTTYTVASLGNLACLIWNPHQDRMQSGLQTLYGGRALLAHLRTQAAVGLTSLEVRTILDHMVLSDAHALREVGTRERMRAQGRRMSCKPTHRIAK